MDWRIEMFKQYRINRIKREVAILTAKFDLLRDIYLNKTTTSYYTDNLLKVTCELTRLRFNLKNMESRL
jgi:hypothetical protein